jgi:hypothetical protein
VPLRTSNVVLLVAASLLLTACGGKEPVSAMDVEKSAFQDYTAEVRVTVTDESRAEEVLALVEQFEQEFALFRKLIVDQRIEVRALNSNYDTTREDFDAFIASNQEQMQAARDRVTDAHLALIASTTPEEWESLHKSTTEAMDKLSRSLRSY